VNYIQREHKVTVWSTECSVTVYQKYKTVWIAVGYYMDERIECKDQRRVRPQALDRSSSLQRRLSNDCATSAVYYGGGPIPTPRRSIFLFSCGDGGLPDGAAGTSNPSPERKVLVTMLLA
jgi:hypothetical protein